MKAEDVPSYRASFLSLMDLPDDRRLKMRDVMASEPMAAAVRILGIGELALDYLNWLQDE